MRLACAGFCQWLQQCRDDPRARRQVFWVMQRFSTSTVAALIGEELLVRHCIEALRLRMVTPCVRTAGLTLPWFPFVIARLSTGGAGRA